MRALTACLLLAISVTSGVAHANWTDSFAQHMRSSTAEQAADAAAARAIEHRVATLSGALAGMGSYERQLRLNQERAIQQKNQAWAREISGNPRFRGR